MDPAWDRRTGHPGRFQAGGSLPGLGLVLADAVVRTHGGTLELLNVQSGFAVDLYLTGANK